MGLGVEIGKLIVAFLVLINPFSALSIYLDLTHGHSTKERSGRPPSQCLPCLRYLR